MCDERSGSWVPDDWTVERVIVFAVLRTDHEVRWSLAELQCRLDDVEPERVREAVERLARLGVVRVHEEWVLASRSTQRLDELGVISI